MRRWRLQPPERQLSGHNRSLSVTLLLAYYPAVEYEELLPGATFTLREGGSIVGYGEVVDSPFA